MGLSRLVKRLPPPSTNPSRRERGAGVTLFLLVTACWTLWLASAEQGWIGYGDGYGSFVLLIAAGLSAISLVMTGYLLGRTWAALWLGWVPGATMAAVGFSMTPTPGGDEAGGGLIFIGGLLLMLGWPAYFFPLIAIGAALRRRRVKRLASARVLDERPVNRRVRLGIGASVVVVGVAAATYYAIPRDSSAPTTAGPPPALAGPEPVAGPLCKQPGIRYAGTTAQGAEVCFTLTPDGSELVETGFSFVGASGCPDGAEGTVHSGYPGTVDPSGHFEIPEGLTARIHGVRASGVLEDSDICPGKKFEWSARRAP